ncbi:ATP-binding protein [Aquibacillus salsiterrae]|uniref:histidine kinase n=1 Tax=Aquibacillus salsiterrae TaxID=2950439 RepID=A0A9X4AF89_9BACI|nr:ATP-binding protein [Aquibacillus salsiterrae]MDC3417611.1 ATP-binding protein [Aquibacillus salsiterrae]
MFNFENYLFALLVILIPVFIYFSFFYKKYPTKVNYYIIGFLCAIAIIISMSYPFNLATGHVYDMRTIPWLIAFLYGGRKMGLFATLVIFIYRARIGIDEGFLITIIAFSLSAVIVSLFIKKYERVELREKLKISVLLTLFSVSLIVIGLLSFIRKVSYTEIPMFITYFFVSNLLTIVLVVYIVETLMEKERNRVQIQQAERVKLIGEMAASVAHEIKNPLTIVMGFTQILKGDKNLTEKQHSSLQLIDSELNRAQKIIYDYLSLAKTNEKDFERLNCVEVIENVIDVTKYHAQISGVEIINQTNGNFIVRANRNELTQVFLNMIKNAVESIDGSGQVIVSTQQVGKYLQVTIIDNGKGMDEEDVNSLGTPYFTTKENGTGLGMMVCFKIIDSLKGEINVTSIKGEGTTFKITLPLADEE